MPWGTDWVRWMWVYLLLVCFLPAGAANPGKPDSGPGVDPPAAESASAPTPATMAKSVPASQTTSAPKPASPSALASPAKQLSGPESAAPPDPVSAPEPAGTPKLASGLGSGPGPATPTKPVPSPEPALPADLSSKEAAIGGELPEAKPVPAMQVVPLPYDQASFQYLGRELTRYHFGPSLRRPFLYPVAGPEGRSLTRMGHPRDPFGHSHHNSVWISHADVGGVNFWADRDKTPPGRILCQRIEQYEDGPQSAWLVAVHAWQDAQEKTILLERRRIEVQVVDPEHWWILIDMELAPPGQQPVTLGQTPFGMIGVRMAKTIGVSDGGGRLLNSEGQLGEVAMFRKPARWVDYSGPILPLPPTGTSEPKSPASLCSPPVDHPERPAPAQPPQTSFQAHLSQTSPQASQPQMSPPPHPSQTTPHAEQPRPTLQAAPPQTTAPPDKPQMTLHAEQPRPSCPAPTSTAGQSPAGAGNLAASPARSGAPGSTTAAPAGPPHFAAAGPANLGFLGPANSDASRLPNSSSAGANTSGAAGLTNSDVAGQANLSAAGPARSGNPSPGLAKYCAGITLMDHPANPGHPTPFHVRADGWMGASLTLAGPITIQPGQPLRLRYGLWIHPGVPNRAEIDAQWRQFAQTPPAFPTRKTP